MVLHSFPRLPHRVITCTLYGRIIHLETMISFSNDLLSNGTKFKDRNVSKNNGTSQLPQIAAQGNNVYVVWQDNTPGNYDILLKRSPNNG